VTRIRILVEHGGETFDYDADKEATAGAGVEQLGGLIDQAVDVVKRAIGVPA